MYGLIGKITTRPGRCQELIGILVAATREMPGCLSYVVAADRAEEDVIWVTEIWAAKKDHEASLRLAPVKDAISKGRPLIASVDQIAVTEPADDCKV